MDIPYYTVPFSLSQEALTWIKFQTASVVEQFQKNSVPPAGLVPMEFQDWLVWQDSIAWKEIVEFVNKYNLPRPDLQFFIYKKLDLPLPDSRGNPHIDTTVPADSDRGVDGAKRDVPVRFNILLDGNEDQEMVWWDIDRNHSLVETVMFMRPNGKEAARLQVKGGTPAGRWHNVGEPEWRYSTLTKLNEYASFVRTDKLHAINWDGKNPRLILSLRFLMPWEELISKVSQ